MPRRKNPLAGFQFAIEIQGVVQGYFAECFGMGSEHELIEHKVTTSSGQEVILKLPGRLKWENITLRRGITSSLDLWRWRQQVIDGDVAGARRNGSIVMLDQTLKEVARWEFARAWPVKVSVPQPRADSPEIVVEELTLTHEYIRRVS